MYTGQFQHNTFHGMGTLTVKKKNYKGKWKNGILEMVSGKKIDRFGKEWKGKDVNTDEYSILHINKELSGSKGLWITKTNDLYRGELVNDYYHGQGVLIDHNYTIYSGEWNNHRREGQGVSYEFCSIEKNQFISDKIHEIRIIHFQANILR